MQPSSHWEIQLSDSIDTILHHRSYFLSFAVCMCMHVPARMPPWPEELGENASQGKMCAAAFCTRRYLRNIRIPLSLEIQPRSFFGPNFSPQEPPCSSSQICDMLLQDLQISTRRMTATALTEVAGDRRDEPTGWHHQLYPYCD